MNLKLLVYVLLLILTNTIAAQNHMDIMTTMTGEHNFAEMGWLMTTLDWNGDNYDDLVIMESGWRPDQYRDDLRVSAYGKLNIYLGGPAFDNIPEIVIPGSYQQEYWATFSMCNAGHMNNDQYDDLALFRATPFEGDPQLYDLQLCVFYGGANPDTIPDYVLTFPMEEWDNEYCFVRGLGDINHDGFDDIGYYMVKPIYPEQIKFGIIYGGAMLNVDFLEISNVRGTPNICGIGDVNADGIDDFCVGYGYSSGNESHYKIILYYGNSSSTYNDSLVILDSSNLISLFSYPAGDLNWDGHPDFVSSFSSSEAKLYFGGPGFNGTDFVTISPPYHGNALGNGFGHGDVNGNGTDDLMGTYCSQLDFGYGDAFLWMGGVPMNGDADLHITPPDYAASFDMFGWCLTMGDYNGDGYCDAAISAPFDYAGVPDPGRVFVYMGNPQLNDPLPIADETQIPVISKMRLYPNPLQPQQGELNVSFSKLTPLPPSSRGVTTFEIYNIKGQKVKSFTLTAEQAKAGSVSFNLNDLSSGIYVCLLTNDKQQLKGKLTIMR